MLPHAGATAATPSVRARCRRPVTCSRAVQEMTDFTVVQVTTCFAVVPAMMCSTGGVLAEVGDMSERGVSESTATTAMAGTI